MPPDETYLLLIGARHVIPPLPADELRRLYELVLRLAPGSTTSVRVNPRLERWSVEQPRGVR